MTRRDPQYLTAKIKLRPSRRKAAILERVRSRAEDVFWEKMTELRPAAERLLAIEKKRDRKAELKRLTNPVQLKDCGLPAAIRDGLASDLERSISSYIELKLGDFAPEWPARQVPHESRYEYGLDLLANSTSKEEEDVARDEIYRGGQDERYRPFILTRGRECRLLRKEKGGPIVAALEVVALTDAWSRRIQIAEGMDACTGEILPAKKSARQILIPVSISKWHENKFLSGSSVLRSCIITREGDDWYMNAQFEMATPEEISPEGVLGLDRGIATLVSGAHINMNGRVREVLSTPGNKPGEQIHRYEKKNCSSQRRRGVPRKGHRQAVEQILHELANEIVAIAKEGRLAVAMAKLDDLKSAITKKRPKGARRSRWVKQLKKIQISKLEQILTYKLNLAGLPPLQEVLVPGTSQTCSSCGHRDKKNRVSREEFHCQECGSEFHADINAGVQIARRGVISLQRLNKKGSKMDALHKNMVDDLFGLDDAGLGPLPASAGKGFVAVLDAARSANDRTSSGLRPRGSKNSADDRQKTRSDLVFSESGDPIFVNFTKHLVRIRCGAP